MGWAINKKSQKILIKKVFFSRLIPLGFRYRGDAI